MSAILLSRDQSVLFVIDLQEKFLTSVWEADRVVRRTTFLIEVARLLEIPVIATTQNSDRLGALDQAIRSLAGDGIEKMSFSCWGCETFRSTLEGFGRSQVVLTGVETHICVGLTCGDLLRAGYEVAVCPDAVSSSDVERHKLGMERIRDSGATPIHSEAVAYEWMGTAEDARFKPMLHLVKQYR